MESHGNGQTKRERWYLLNFVTSIPSDWILSHTSLFCINKTGVALNDVAQQNVLGMTGGDQWLLRCTSQKWWIRSVAEWAYSLTWSKICMATGRNKPPPPQHLPWLTIHSGKRRRCVVYTTQKKQPPFCTEPWREAATEQWHARTRAGLEQTTRHGFLQTSEFTPTDYMARLKPICCYRLHFRLGMCCKRLSLYSILRR